MLDQFTKCEAEQVKEEQQTINTNKTENVAPLQPIVPYFPEEKPRPTPTPKPEHFNDEDDTIHEDAVDEFFNYKPREFHNSEKPGTF